MNPRRGAPLPQSRFSVILVEPQYPDNVGHTARSMLNFGVSDLVLVNFDRGVDERARERAVHAQGVLDEARRVGNLREVRGEFDVLVAFGASISALNKAHLRHSESLEKVARRLEDMPGRIGLVFGREDFGLSNEDIAVCDMMCTIPTSPAYRSMNLSHSVSVALYELLRSQHKPLPSKSMASPHEREVLFAAWYQLGGELGFPEHRRRQSLQMLRRLIGRSGLTTWEYHRFMGVLSRSLKPRGAWPVRLEDLPADLFDELGDPEDVDEGEDEPHADGSGTDVGGPDDRSS